MPVAGMSIRPLEDNLSLAATQQAARLMKGALVSICTVCLRPTIWVLPPAPRPQEAVMPPKHCGRRIPCMMQTGDPLWVLGPYEKWT